MSQPSSFTDFISEAIRRNCIEPKQRMCAGEYGFVRHRFPIKGGINHHEALSRTIAKNNSLLSFLMAKDKP